MFKYNLCAEVVFRNWDKREGEANGLSSGRVLARAEYLRGEDRYLVEYVDTEDGKCAKWFLANLLQDKGEDNENS
ncbi:MAG: hypothetical protein DRH08_06550 [Deltaproteobacteria bacterium]|nr:MAG: hypothetical protein DRH08_06550 [Deltaproteobacteria bacterium]